MAKTLEDYTREISDSYVGTRGAIQKQIDSIDGNLVKAQEQINKQYANQQAQLQRNANDAASAASIRAAGNGGSFGGNAAIANQKYYNQTFAPAMMQSQTNQSQALENAETNANDRRISLEGQLAQIEDTVAQNALNRYYAQQEADRQYELQQQQLALQRAAQAQQNSYYKYLMDAAQSSSQSTLNNGKSTNSYGQTYKGNDDFRGWLAAGNFATPSMSGQSLLDYVGNDGKVNLAKAGLNGIQIQELANKAYNQWLKGRN